jgi:hypothetical protein
VPCFLGRFDCYYTMARTNSNILLWNSYFGTAPKGKKLDGRAVAVEARRVADQVIAIVQPVEPVQPKAKRPEPKSLFEA